MLFSLPRQVLLFIIVFYSILSFVIVLAIMCLYSKLEGTGVSVCDAPYKYRLSTKFNLIQNVVFSFLFFLFFAEFHFISLIFIFLSGCWCCLVNLSEQSSTKSSLRSNGLLKASKSKYMYTGKHAKKAQKKKWKQTTKSRHMGRNVNSIFKCWLLISGQGEDTAQCVKGKAPKGTGEKALWLSIEGNNCEMKFT